MGGRRLGGAVAATLMSVLVLHNADARASVVEHGYFPLSDGTRLSYTLTRPSAVGRFPTVLKYDPYSAGVTSDPTWNDSGYAMLGVNFRGTGCSSGEFQPLRSDIWGKDGAAVVAWAAGQPWGDGRLCGAGVEGDHSRERLSRHLSRHGLPRRHPQRVDRGVDRGPQRRP